jgi:hypothetical protein
LGGVYFYFFIVFNSSSILLISEVIIHILSLSLSLSKRKDLKPIKSWNLSSLVASLQAADRKGSVHHRTIPKVSGTAHTKISSLLGLP